MDALFSQLSLLANDALDNNKNFNPSRIEELLHLFEREAHASFAAAEAAHLKAAHEAEAAMKEAEEQLNSILDASAADLATVKSAFARSKIHPS